MSVKGMMAWVVVGIAGAAAGGALAAWIAGELVVWLIAPGVI